MAHYLIQASYTAESWGQQVRSPQNLVERIRPTVEKLGGRLEQAYYTFGEYDVIGIAQFPDNTSAAAFALAASAGGAVKALKTTPLMAVEEGMQAMRKAADAGYRPPGG